MRPKEGAITMNVLHWIRLSTLCVLVAMVAGYLVALAGIARGWMPGGLIAGGMTAALTLAAGILLAHRGSSRVAVAGEVTAWSFLAPFAVWLAWDPAPASPAGALGPLIPDGAEAARGLYLEACDGGACEGWEDIFAPDSELEWLSPENDPEHFAQVVAASTDGIEAAWERAAPGRAWIAEVNGQPVFSDFVERFDSKIMNIQVVRALARVHALRAASQALDGRADEALATLGPLARFAVRLQRDGRALITVMIANVLERMVVDHASFVLARGTPGADDREALAAALAAGANDGRDLARALRVEADMLVRLIESAETADLAMLDSSGFGGWNRFLASPFLFNRHGTAGELRRHHERAAALAQAGDLTALQALETEFQEEHSGLHVKNPVGHMLARMASPALVKLTGNLHRSIAVRNELVLRLRGLEHADTPSAR